MNELNIVFPISCYYAVRELKDGERGRLMLGVYDYCTMGKEPNLVGCERALWPEFKAAIDEQWEREEEIRQARAEGGKLGGRPRKCDCDCDSKNLKVLEEKSPPLSPLPLSPIPPISNPPIIPPKEKSAQRDADFERFWKAYPKKKDKAYAKKAFAKVTTPLETILKALEAQKKDTDWVKDNGKFIPYPSTWLNGQRWEDELTLEQPKENWNDTHRFVPTGDFEGYWEELVDGEWRRMER